MYSALYFVPIVCLHAVCSTCICLPLERVRGNLQRKWINAAVNLPARTHRFSVEAVRGGETVEDDRCDVAVDTFRVELGPCWRKTIN